MSLRKARGERLGSGVGVDEAGVEQGVGEGEGLGGGSTSGRLRVPCSCVALDPSTSLTPSRGRGVAGRGVAECGCVR